MSEQPGHVVPDYANPKTQDRPRGRWRGFFGWFMFILLCIALFLLLQKRSPTDAISISLSDFHEQLLAGQIRSLTIQKDEITGQFVSAQKTDNGTTASFRTALPPQFSNDWPFINWVLQNRKGANVTVDNQDNLLMTVLMPLIPWFLIFGFIWFFVFRQLRRRSGTQAEPLRVIIVNPVSPTDPRC